MKKILLIAFMTLSAVMVDAFGMAEAPVHVPATETELYAAIDGCQPIEVVDLMLDVERARPEWYDAGCIYIFESLQRNHASKEVLRELIILFDPVIHPSLVRQYEALQAQIAPDASMIHAAHHAPRGSGFWARLKNWFSPCWKRITVVGCVGVAAYGMYRWLKR